MDHWSTERMQSITGAKCHFFNKNFDMKEKIFTFKHFEGQQTGENVIKDMESIIDDMQSEVVTIRDAGYYITDNATNKVKACKLLYTKVNALISVDEITEFNDENMDDNDV